MFIPLAYQREQLNFIRCSIEGLARSNFISYYIPLYGLFGELYNILKGRYKHPRKSVESSHYYLYHSKTESVDKSYSSDDISMS